MATMTINGDRVRQAREIRGISQSKLAEAIDVDQSYLSYVEAGLREPSSEVLERIAVATQFPPAFFRRESAPEFPLGSLLFRRRDSLPSDERDQLRQAARLAYEIFDEMAARFKSMDIRIPRLTGEYPREAAGLTRAAMGLSPDTPITNLINRLERNGVILLLLPLTVKRADGFSVWADTEPRRPVIVLTGGWPGDRQRFSVAHELGHLVLHQTPNGSPSAMDAESDAFASEFLLPSDALRQDLSGGTVTLTLLAQLKSKWGVSMQAIARQAQNLSVITEGQRKYLDKQMGIRGWMREEPVKLAPEKPRLFRKMAESLYGIPTDSARVAALASAPAKLVDEILDSHASRADLARPAKPTSVEGISTETRANVLQFKPRKMRA